MDSSEELFTKNHVAARSLKNAWTRLASTYGCIMAVLTRSTLTITPHRFAKWLIILLGLDLCHEIPVNCMKSVTEAGKCCGHGKVELHYRTAEGKDRGILLYMRNYREFVDKASNAMDR